MPAVDVIRSVCGQVTHVRSHKRTHAQHAYTFRPTPRPNTHSGRQIDKQTGPLSGSMAAGVGRERKMLSLLTFQRHGLWLGGNRKDCCFPEHRPPIYSGVPEREVVTFRGER